MFLKGQLETLQIHSDLLQGNPLGDPSTRDCPVYLPPNYKPQDHYPLLIDLAPYTSSGLARVSWKNTRVFPRETRVPRR